MTLTVKNVVCSCFHCFCSCDRQKQKLVASTSTAETLWMIGPLKEVVARYHSTRVRIISLLMQVDY